MYVYIYIYKCIHSNVHTHIYVHIYTCQNTSLILTNKCIYIYIYISIYIYIYTHLDCVEVPLGLSNGVAFGFAFPSRV